MATNVRRNKESQLSDTVWFKDIDKNECNGSDQLQSCPFTNRLEILLNIYKQSDVKVLSEFIGSNKYTLSLLCDDFHHILSEHDKDLQSVMNYMNKSHIICNDDTLNSCKSLVRNYRDRSTFMYEEKDKDLISFIQRMDAIHTYIFHSFHMSYRLTNKQKNIIYNNIEKQEQKYDTDSDTQLQNIFDESLDKVSKIMQTNRKRLTQIIDNDRLSENKKFVTEIHTHVQKTDENKNENETDVKTEEIADDIEYSLGKPFKYDKHYKYDFWYICRKYSSLKSEMLLNKTKTLTKEQFNNEYKKAQYFQTSRYGKSINYCYFTKEREGGLVCTELEQISSITINHILSILIYCNYTTLCTVFSTTFRKVSKSETNESLKLRNREYANMSKYLYEAVNYFGDRVRYSSDLKQNMLPKSWPECGVFHGISTEMLFTHAYGSFFGPLSTTTKRNVAINFTNHKGIMLRLNAYFNPEHRDIVNHNYFNCSFLSDFTAESEYLFFRIILKIDSIIHIELKQNYRWFTEAIQVLQAILKSPTPPADKGNIIRKHYLKYFSNMIEGKNDMYPIYTNKLFQRVMNEINEIIFDIWLWSVKEYKSFRDHKYYGYVDLRQLFMEDHVDFVKMLKLCPNVKQIHIINVNTVTSKREPSIALSDEFLEYLLSLNSILVSTKISHIFIYEPYEKIISVPQFIKKYQQKCDKTKKCFQLRSMKENMSYFRRGAGGHLENINILCIYNPDNLSFYDYVENNEYELFKQLLKRTENHKTFAIDINKKREKDGNNILLYCIKLEKFKFLKYLLDNYRTKINIDETDNDGMTALNFCVSKNYFDGAQILLRFGADLNTQEGINKNTPLIIATKNDNMKMVKLLLLLNKENDYEIKSDNEYELKPADTNILNKQNRSSLYYAAYQYENFEMMKLLIEKGKFTNWTGDEYGLFYAVILGNVKLVKELLEKNENIDINIQTQYLQWVGKTDAPDETLLHTSCRFYSVTNNENYFDIIQILLNKQNKDKIKSWIDIQDYRSFDRGKTCIWYAIVMKDMKLFNLLKQYNPDFNKPNEVGVQFDRANYRFTEDNITYKCDYMLAFPKLILPQKYNPPERNNIFVETSPFTLACFVGNNTIIEYLLNTQQNIDVFPNDTPSWNKGLNSFQLCAMNGNIIGLKLIYEYLLKNKTEDEIKVIVNIQERDSGLTAFHFSCIKGHLITTKYLVQIVKVNVNLKDKNSIDKKHMENGKWREGVWTPKRNFKTGLFYAKKYKHKEIVSFLSTISNIEQDNKTNQDNEVIWKKKMKKENILNEIASDKNENENKSEEKQKQKQIFQYWYNRSITIYDSISSGLYDDIFKLNYEERENISDDLKKLGDKWEMYYLKMSSDIANKFEQWYNNLMKEQQQNQMKQKAVCCFQWRLPRYRLKDVELLIYGYYKNIKSNENIINITVNYFGKFDDNTLQNTIGKWKNAKEGENFYSGIFDYKSIKFYFRIDKVDQSYKAEKNEQYRLYLIFIAAPKNVFYRCDIQLSCMWVEKSYKIVKEFNIKIKEYENKTILFENIGSDDIFETIYHHRQATFNLYFHQVKFVDHQKNSIKYEADEMKLLIPVIIDTDLMKSDNMVICKWKLSENDIDQIKKVTTLKKEKVFTIKSKIYSVCGLFQCQMYMKIDSPVETVCEDGGRSLSYGTCDFNVSIFGLPSFVNYLYFWYGIKFKGKMLYRERSIASITNGKSFIILDQNMLTTIDFSDSLNKYYKQPEFEWCIQIMDIFDKNNNKIIQNDNLYNNEELISNSPMKSFKWNVSETLLKEMKECKSSANFFSPPFKVHSFVFVLEIHPKKKSFSFDEPRLNGFIEVHLVKIPYDLNIERVVINQNKYVIETGHNFFDALTLNVCDDIGVHDPSYSELLKSIDAIKLKGNTITFCSDIQILNVLDQNNNNITNTIISYEDEDEDEKKEEIFKSYYFEWKIPSKYYKKDMYVTGGTQICSEIFELFGCKWCFVFIPKEAEDDKRMHLYLYRIDINVNIPLIAIHCKFIINEMDLSFSTVKRFDNNFKIGTKILWEYFIEKKQIENKQSLTFAFEMTLFDIYKINNDKPINYIDETKKEIKELEINNKQFDTYKWQIPMMNEKKRHISPIYKIKGINIEFQMDFDRKIKRDMDDYSSYSEIWICIKELPKHIENISILFAIHLYVIPHDDNSEINIKVQNIAHFTNNKLEVQLTNLTKFELKYLLPLKFTINTKIISINKKKKLMSNEEKEKEKKKYKFQTKSLGEIDVTKKWKIHKFKPINRDEIETDALCCYQWRLQTKYDLLKQIKDMNSTRGNYIDSGVFDYKGLKFALRLYPYGQLIDEKKSEEKDNENENELSIVLDLISNLSNGEEIYQCHLVFEIELVELAIKIQKYEKQLNKVNINDELFKYITLTDLIKLERITFNVNFIGIIGNNFNTECIIQDEAEENKMNILKPIIINKTMFDINNTDNSLIFKWNLPQKDITKFRNAKDNYKPIIDVIRSDIFIMHGFRCQIWIYPTGKYMKHYDEGKCSIIIYMIGLPYRYKMITYCNIALNNKLLSKKNPVVDFDHYTYSITAYNILTTNQLIGAETLTFYCKLLDILDEDEKYFDINKLKIDKNLISFPCYSYQWKIDNKLLSEIKKSTIKSHFCSKLFNMFGFTFMLVIYPKRLNHDNGITNGKYVFLIELFLHKIPKNLKLKKLSFYYSYSLIELNLNYSRITQFESDEISTGTWDNELLLFDKIKQLKSLTINCDIQILNGYNSNGDDITNNIINSHQNQILIDDIKEMEIETPKPHYFEWKIPSKYYLNDISPGTQIATEIFEFFGCKWYIVFIPRATIKSENIAVIIFREIMDKKLYEMFVWFTLIISEIEFVETIPQKLTCDNTHDKIVFTLMKKETIQNMKDYLTIGFQVTLFDCYDKNEINIRNKYDICKVNIINQLKILNYKKDLQWEIKSKYLKRERTRSPTFELKHEKLEMKCAMLFYPIDHDTETSVLYMGSIEELPDNIDKIYLMVTVRIEKINVLMSRVIYLQNDRLIACLSKVTKLEINTEESITFDVNVKVIQILEK